MVGQFAEVCRRGLKVNTGKSKVIVLNGEERLECEFHIDGIHLKHRDEPPDLDEMPQLWVTTAL